MSKENGGPALKCNECAHREWEEGDHSETPPGYGIYFCNLVAYPGGYLTEQEARGLVAPKTCALTDIRAMADMEGKQ